VSTTALLTANSRRVIMTSISLVACLPVYRYFARLPAARGRNQGKWQMV
jgi:hypothetical protein